MTRFSQTKLTSHSSPEIALDSPSRHPTRRFLLSIAAVFLAIGCTAAYAAGPWTTTATVVGNGSVSPASQQVADRAEAFFMVTEGADAFYDQTIGIGCQPKSYTGTTPLSKQATLDANVQTSNCDLTITFKTPNCAAVPNIGLSGAPTVITCSNFPISGVISFNIAGATCSAYSFTTKTVVCSGAIATQIAPNPTWIGQSGAYSASQGPVALAVLNPTCTAVPASGLAGRNVQITCTSIPTGGTVTIPGAVCGAESGNVVVCTGITGFTQVTINPNPTATVTDTSNTSVTTNVALTIDPPVTADAVAAPLLDSAMLAVLGALLSIGAALGFRMRSRDWFQRK